MYLVMGTLLDIIQTTLYELYILVLAVLEKVVYYLHLIHLNLNQVFKYIVRLEILKWMIQLKKS
nr:MAG TPA: hypothetical protein [Bacteriophage sp.]